MAVSNRDRVGRALELVRGGHHPFVDRIMRERKPLEGKAPELRDGPQQELIALNRVYPSVNNQVYR
jgi:hypothetical protein